MLLDDLAIAVYHEFQTTRVFFTFDVNFGDLHPEAVRRRFGVQGNDAEIAKNALGGRLDRRRVRGGTVFARTVPDAHDVGVPATVLEVREDGLRQARSVDHTAERLGELGPVAYQGGLIERPLLGEADEGGHGGPDSFDWP